MKLSRVTRSVYPESSAYRSTGGGTQTGLSSRTTLCAPRGKRADGLKCRPALIEDWSGGGGVDGKPVEVFFGELFYSVAGCVGDAHGSVRS